MLRGKSARSNKQRRPLCIKDFYRKINVVSLDVAWYAHDDLESSGARRKEAMELLADPYFAEDADVFAKNQFQSP